MDTHEESKKADDPKVLETNSSTTPSKKKVHYEEAESTSGFQSSSVMISN